MSPPARKRPRRGVAPPIGEGWRTSDEDEVERRRRRGAEEDIEVRTLERVPAFFATFAARSASGDSYTVEMRSMDERINACDCRDFQVNGLGTCKHVEAVLHTLSRRRGRAAAARAGSPRVEVFLDRRDERVKVRWPAHERASSAAHRALDAFFDGDGALLGDPVAAWSELERTVAGMQARTRTRVRLSAQLAPWIARLRRLRDAPRARAAYEADVTAGRRPAQVLDKPLYPYQTEGMLHLAFTGRALLADEMGLGKTVQAIAACELLARLHGVERVLVVAPASLKGEWQDQIATFTARSSVLVQGPPAARRRQYREPAFFYLANYEQVLQDRQAMNELLAPDVVVLDEAQRIKNWQSRTAREVKRLASPFAFVLTGTPLENRIDEIYSIVEMLDPHALGPLFRFNREFYQLDERGRPVGYRNLDELHRRLRPVMLRRRKEDVEGDLPPRTVNHYFVPMHDEQRGPYDEHSASVARLAAIARRRPLNPREWDRLQRSLACMRMLCDTPYILDRQTRIAPKLDELEAVLAELMADGRKAIVFSEWVRMLELVAERVEAMRLDFVVHTGRVSQRTRREAVRRFQTDPECRVLLASDSGATGLNLQAASVIVNMDLPWNPAVLEQRIARAWRKHQTRPVHVVNLVTEDSIEHRMLDLLEGKRAVAAAVVDGAPGGAEMTLPSGRKALLERVQAVMTPPPAQIPGARPGAAARDPGERFRDAVLGTLEGRVQRLELAAPTGLEATTPEAAPGPAVLVVLDTADDAAQSAVTGAAASHLGVEPAQVQVLDAATWAALQRLMEAGLIAPGPRAGRLLHATPAPPHGAERTRRRAAARPHLEQAGHRLRMAELLAGGGFAAEALPAMREAVDSALCALACLHGEPGESAPDAERAGALLAAIGIDAGESLAAVHTEVLARDGHELQQRLDAGALIVRAVAGATEAPDAPRTRSPPPVHSSRGPIRTSTRRATARGT